MSKKVHINSIFDEDNEPLKTNTLVDGSPAKAIKVTDSMALSDSQLKNLTAKNTRVNNPEAIIKRDAKRLAEQKQLLALENYEKMREERVAKQELLKNMVKPKPMPKKPSFFSRIFG